MLRSLFLSLTLEAAPILAQTDPIVHTTADLHQREAKLLAAAKASPGGVAFATNDNSRLLQNPPRRPSPHRRRRTPSGVGRPDDHHRRHRHSRHRRHHAGRSHHRSRRNPRTRHPGRKRSDPPHRRHPHIAANVPHSVKNRPRHHHHLPHHQRKIIYLNQNGMPIFGEALSAPNPGIGTKTHPLLRERTIIGCPILSSLIAKGGIYAARASNETVTTLSRQPNLLSRPSSTQVPKQSNVDVANRRDHKRHDARQSHPPTCPPASGISAPPNIRRNHQTRPL